MKELNEYRSFMKKEELHKSLNSLIGILEGISSDGVITAAENEEVKNWYELHRALLDAHPFNEIFPVIDVALSDDRIDMEEVEDVLWLCRKFTEESELYFNLITSKIQQLEGMLYGMLYGMLSDGALSDTELRQLNN